MYFIKTLFFTTILYLSIYLPFAKTQASNWDPPRFPKEVSWYSVLENGIGNNKVIGGRKTKHSMVISNSIKLSNGNIVAVSYKPGDGKSYKGTSIVNCLDSKNGNVLWRTQLTKATGGSVIRTGLCEMYNDSNGDLVLLGVHLTGERTKAGENLKAVRIILNPNTGRVKNIIDGGSDPIEFLGWIGNIIRADDGDFFINLENPVNNSIATILKVGPEFTNESIKSVIQVPCPKFIADGRGFNLQRLKNGNFSLSVSDTLSNDGLIIFDKDMAELKTVNFSEVLKAKKNWGLEIGMANNYITFKGEQAIAYFNLNGDYLWQKPFLSDNSFKIFDFNGRDFEYIVEYPVGENKVVYSFNEILQDGSTVNQGSFELPHQYYFNGITFSGTPDGDLLFTGTGKVKFDPVTFKRIYGNSYDLIMKFPSSFFKRSSVNGVNNNRK
jgi:hypothetical protein